MKVERNALQKKVFPKLKELCMKHGCRFQPIDLRWGVREEAALNQQTMEICLEEIDRCLETTPRPNFIVLLGDRYGWRPLPYEIPVEEFEAILLNLPQDQEENQHQKALLENWYHRDDNADPPIYCLQPRRKKFKNEKKWTQVERNLRSIFLDAIKKMNLDDEAKVKYLASATEQEILHGALSVKENSKKVFCFFRRIKTPLNSSMNDYVDLDVNNNLDQDAREHSINLKNRLKRKFPEGIYNYEVEWSEKGITATHIDDLCNDVFNSLSEIISEEITQLEEKDAVKKEIEDHEKFGRERRKFFTGRVSILHRINKYIEGDKSQPLVIFGKSGSGKSALMAHAIKQVQERFPDSEVIYRFLGVTPNSSNGRALIESLCKQIGRILGEDMSSIPNDYKKLVMDFQKKLGTSISNKPLILFLDALDQLSNIDNARNLQWLPINLSERVRVIVSTIPSDCYENLKLKLPIKDFIEIEPLQHQEGETILNLWLKNANRTLQPAQKREVLNKFALNGLPLYLKLAFEEARHWKSFTDIKKTSLSPTVIGIIRYLFARLSLEPNHGKLMVSHSLGYLAASKNGLTEDELIDVLSQDKKVYENFEKRTRHQPPEEKLPVIVWSRLFFDLEPYLTERSADGTALLSFFHRQLSEVVEQEYLTGKVKINRHNALARYFALQDLYIMRDDKTVANLRKVSELPYHVVNSVKSKYESKEQELTVIKGTTDCLIEVSTEIIEDFNLHANEIKPIISWLVNLKEYDYVIKLTDATLDQLEKQGNWPTIQSISDSAIYIANIKDLKINNIRYQFALSRALYHMALYSDAIKLGENALILAEELENKAYQASINCHLGSVWRFEGDRAKAINYIRKAEDINLELDNPVIRGKCMFSRAIIEYDMDNLPKAREPYDLILEMVKNNNIRSGMGARICDLLRTRGLLWFVQDEFKLARASWELMKQYAEEMYGELPLKRAISRLTLIDIIEGKINIEQMKHAWKEELKILLLRQERASALTCYGEVAEVYIREGSLESLNEAIELCRQAEPIIKEINNLHTRAGINYVRGIRAIAEGKITEAKEYLEKSEELFGKWTSPYRYWVSKTFKRLGI